MKKDELQKYVIDASLKYSTTKSLFDTIGKIAKYIAVCVVAFFIYLIVKAVSGKTTVFDFGVNLLSEMNASKWFAYLFGAGCFIYGRSERKNNKKIKNHYSDQENIFMDIIKEGEKSPKESCND